MFVSLSTARLLGLSNLSHHRTIPPTLQTMSQLLVQLFVVKISMMISSYAYEGASQ